MKVKTFAESLNMKIVTGESGLEREISGVYTCDLLSWVMSHVGKGDAWITVHTHINVAAVATLTEIPCIIIPENICIEEATIKKASEEDIAILSTDMKAYEICWKAKEILD